MLVLVLGFVMVFEARDDIFRHGNPNNPSSPNNPNTPWFLYHSKHIYYKSKINFKKFYFPAKILISMFLSMYLFIDQDHLVNTREATLFLRSHHHSHPNNLNNSANPDELTETLLTQDDNDEDDRVALDNPDNLDNP